MQRFVPFITGIAFIAGSAFAAAPEAVKECVECHGDQGVSTDKDVPTIAGMSAFYLEEQMFAYQRGDRPCVEAKDPDSDEITDMCKIAKEFNEDQIIKIADYLAKQAFVPAEQEFDPSKAAQGKKIHERNCEKCHSEGGSLAFDDAGIMAGQWKPYLEQTMADYIAGKRWMPEKMKPKMEELNEADVDALIHFYISQGPK